MKAAKGEMGKVKSKRNEVIKTCFRCKGAGCCICKGTGKITVHETEDI